MLNVKELLKLVALDTLKRKEMNMHFRENFMPYQTKACSR